MLLVRDESLLTLTERDPTGRFLLDEFVGLVDNNPSWDDDERTLIYEAIELMYEAHGVQDRGNGDAYITHPLRVAIDLCMQNASARLVAAGLLHDAPEDRAQAVSEYLMHERTSADQAVSLAAIHHKAPSSPTRSDYIELSLALLREHQTFSPAAVLVDEVTNRAYPPEIDALIQSDVLTAAKHAYRADQIKRHARAGSDEALLKFFDTYDNIRSLTRHEALHTEPLSLPRLEKLVEKYSLMIDTWLSLAAELPPDISLDRLVLCQERLRSLSHTIAQRKRLRAIAERAITGVEQSVA